MATNTFSRPDGRQIDQLRPITLTPDFTRYAEGSVLVSWGDTRVLCNLSIQDGVPGWMAGRGKGWMTAEYALLPRSTQTRTPRETHGLKGRFIEIQGTAESEPFSEDMLDQLLALAKSGIQEIVKRQEDLLSQN